MEEANRLKDLYASKISLLIGLETENITAPDLDALEALLKSHTGRIDYLVGSVHHVNEIPIDFDFETYQMALHHGQWATEHEAQESFLCKYFDAQLALLERFHPEVVGHFDLCRLYNPHLRFCDFPAAWERIERNILYVVRYGGLFEVNSAAFKKGWNTAYPGEDIVSVRPLLNGITAFNELNFKQVILKHNGRFVLSDDSHGPHGVGLNYRRLAQYLDKLNITQLWYLRASCTPNAAGRMIEQVKLEGDWRNHSFWQVNQGESTEL